MDIEPEVPTRYKVSTISTISGIIPEIHTRLRYQVLQ